MKKLEEYVKSIPDFPEKGIIFRDVTSVLQDADGLHLAIDTMQEKIKENYRRIKQDALDIIEAEMKRIEKDEKLAETLLGKTE